MRGDNLKEWIKIHGVWNKGTAVKIGKEHSMNKKIFLIGFIWLFAFCFVDSILFIPESFSSGLIALTGILTFGAFIIYKEVMA